MWFLYVLSWISVVIHVCIVTLAIAAALYYLAEIVEEYTVVTCKIIRYTILLILGIYCGLFLFEELPTSIVICGLVNHAAYLMILRTFPFFILTSLPFIGAFSLLMVNHYLAFMHFTSVYYPFSEVMAFFTICLWIVPFSFFISLSANENVLPTIAETQPLIGDNTDVVTSYFSKKGKKYGLLSFFNYAKESILPQRGKKVF